MPNRLSPDDVIASFLGETSKASGSERPKGSVGSGRPYRVVWARCDLCNEAVQGIMFTRHPITDKLGDYCCFCLEDARKELADRPEQLVLEVQ